MSALNLTEMDFKIFEENKKDCNINVNLNDEEIIDQCSHLLRITSGLKYYNLLVSSDSNSNGKEVFIDFCISSYKMCIDDYIHLISVHSDSLNFINKQLINKYKFKNCENVDQCQWTRRHFRVNTNQQNEKTNHFYIQIFDNIHFYLFHLETMGLRCYSISINDDNGDDEKDDDNDYLNCTDKIFEAIQKEIEIKRKKCNYHFDRIENNDFSKFNIAVIQNKKESDQTFIEDMFIYIDNQVYNDNNNNKDDDDDIISHGLKKYIFEQQYDSDAIVQDVEDHKNGNLINIVHNKKKYILYIKQFITSFNISKNTFSTGLVFFYWDWYKNINNDTEIKQQQRYFNQNDFGGKTVCDLYVNAHFDSIQSEVLNCGFIGFSEFKKSVIGKASIYIESEKCKKMKCHESKDRLHFGINKGDPLKPEHLQCLILYTDFTEFCTNFSSSFRSISWSEDLESIKARNGKYHYISKYLREVIQYFGIRGYPNDAEYETGCFFCGMSCVLNVPQFSIRLNGPTSTTKQVAIATRFAGARGIILQLNNKTFSGKKEVFFDSSWLSSYPEEDERIMMGGRCKLELESIRIMENAKNYELFINTYYLWDSMLSGDWPIYSDKKVSPKNVLILKLSINNYLGIKANNFDKYVNDTFYLFNQQKSQIVLNLAEIDVIQEANEEFVSLIMHSVKPQKYSDISYNSTNTFKPILFDVFPNGKEIIIYSSYYAFNISYFLCNVIYSSSSSSSTLLTQSFKSIIIKDRDCKWLNKAFDPKLSIQFNVKPRLNIEFKRKQGRRQKEDWLIICIRIN